MSNLASNYASKASAYAQYRWDYEPVAIDAIGAHCGLRAGDAVADIGAGTGMLSRHFLARGMNVWAVEPEPDMLRIAADLRQSYPDLHLVPATAEATTLPPVSIDLIVAGRALHWFDSPASRAEFMRIAKPPGWLAALAVRCTDDALTSAVRGIADDAGCNPAHSKRLRPKVDLDFYYPAGCKVLHFSGVRDETWPMFLGRMTTFSGVPAEGQPDFEDLAQAARRVFDRFAHAGVLHTPVDTQVHLGRLSV